MTRYIIMINRFLLANSSPESARVISVAQYLMYSRIAEYAVGGKRRIEQAEQPQDHRQEREELPHDVYEFYKPAVLSHFSTSL